MKKLLLISTALMTCFLYAQCNASFNSNATTICSGNTVNFVSTSTGASGFQWKVNGLPFSTSANSSYLFNAAGNYTIRLIVTGAGPCIDSTEITIAVNQTPTINVNVLPTTLYENDSAYVTFSTTGVLPGASYTWNFCDGNFASNTSPFYHQWDDDGTFCVCVQLENLSGCEDNDCENGINVLFFDGIEESSEIVSNVFPNPAANFITVQFKSTFSGSYFLTDLSGKSLMAHTAFYADQILLERGSLHSGIYLLHILDEEENLQVVKLVFN